MTITELLADLEAKAKQVPPHWFWDSYCRIWANVQPGHPLEWADGQAHIATVEDPAMTSGDELRTPEAKAVAEHIAACSPDRVLALVAYVRKLERVAEAAKKELDVRKGIPGSHVFRHDVVLHGGIEHRVGSPCELCDSLKGLNNHAG